MIKINKTIGRKSIKEGDEEEEGGKRHTSLLTLLSFPIKTLMKR